MAIIYTYPRLTNPDGTELIVVSETKNQNATRLLSVADICAFCDESTGCDHSFKYIQTSSLTPAEAVGCDQTLELTSSDATVTITNVGNTIDFKTAGGGGGCPPNYVIKPVTCEEGECFVSTKLAEWVWTCDETLGALAPGYIDSLTLNGTSIPHPGGSTCWYIEAVTLSASATTCETCCTPPGTPTFSFVDCTDSLSYVTVDVDPGLVIGKVFTYCCEPATEFQTVKCWEYVGDVGQPVGGTFDPCINFGAELDNCDCCFNRCNYTYTACVGAPVGFPGTLTFNLGMDPASTCECTSPQNDIVVDDGAGNFWCYNTPESICLPADEGYTILGVPDNPCDDAVYCPPVAATYTWESCDEGGPLVTVAVDPGIPVGQIDRYCCDEGEIQNYCFEYKGNIGELVGGSFPCAGPIETYPADCMCCEFPCTYQYVACPGRPAAFAPTIDVQVPFDISGCDCDTPDPDIYITIGEETWCYNTPTKVCLPPTTTPTGLAVCGDGEICPTPDLRWKMCSEGELDWRYEDPVDPIPAPFNVPGNHYIGELNTPGTCVNGDCCIEVEATVETGTLVGWSTFLGETSCDSAYNATWEDCACCVNYDVVEYTACDETCEVEGVHYPNLYVDVCLWGDHIGESWKPSNAPTFITLSPGGEECCYQLTDQDPCIPETLISTHGFTYDDLGYGDPAWIDCTCTDIVYFQYRECGSAEWIDTDTDLESYDNGSAWGDGTICYEIQQDGAGGPAIDPLVLFPTQYEEGAGGVTACQCCEQDLRLYVICDGAAGVTCNAAAPASLLIDVSSIVGYDPVTYATVIGEEIASSIQCCYTYSDVAECQPPTGTIISTATGCEDVACNLL